MVTVWWRRWQLAAVVRVSVHSYYRAEERVLLPKERVRGLDWIGSVCLSVVVVVVVVAVTVVTVASSLSLLNRRRRVCVCVYIRKYVGRWRRGGLGGGRKGGKKSINQFGRHVQLGGSRGGGRRRRGGRG